MAERLFQNSYIPPDYDPAKMPKKKTRAKNACDVTMMMPFTIQCLTCGEFIYKVRNIDVLSSA